ncbi:hypothetical protein FKV68_12585 [Sinorhizobium mexicanum]|uniref:Uncharacterized protein n=1 Tax=Sinorhizobium mexicanum TaxID=375549 RepID=A0A859QRX8_9HYPH|nr:hypothetical protein FKV68_12585 [Sinorhizobium mexicanum]
MTRLFRKTQTSLLPSAPESFAPKDLGALDSCDGHRNEGVRRYRRAGLCQPNQAVSRESPGWRRRFPWRGSPMRSARCRRRSPALPDCPA